MLRVALLTAVAVVLFLYPEASGQPEGCSLRATQKLNQEQLYQKYRFSVFKVFDVEQKADGSESLTALGTATLIDRRGYFLTASHIFETRPGFTMPGPYPGKLKLVNKEAEITAYGSEKFHRQRKMDPDLSVIKAELPELDDVISPVDPRVEIPPKGMSVMMMGYPVEDVTLLIHNLTPLGDLSPTEMLVVTGGAFHGQSGSLALNSRGEALGILQRRDSQEVVKIFFTLASANELLFLQLDPSSRVVRLLEQMESGNIDQKTRLLLESRGLSNLELIRLVNTLLEQPSRYAAGLKIVRVKIFNHLICNELTEHAYTFSTGTARTSERASFETLDAARAAWRSYINMKAARIESAKLVHLLSGALKLFEETEAKAKLNWSDESPWRTRYASNFYIDYANALREANQFQAIARPKEEFLEKVNLAIKADPENWTPYTFAFQAFNEAGHHEIAARAAASAYKVAPSHKEVLKKDWRDSLLKEREAAVDAVNRGRINRYLSDGIDSAKGLKPDELFYLKGKAGTWQPG